MSKTLTIRYFAIFREHAGLSEETVSLEVETAGDVFELLHARHGAREAQGQCKVAINDQLADWQSPVRDGDTVLLFPPVAGG